MFLHGCHQYKYLYWPLHLAKSGDVRQQPLLKTLSEGFVTDRLKTSDVFTRWSKDAEYGV